MSVNFKKYLNSLSNAYFAQHNKTEPFLLFFLASNNFLLTKGLYQVQETLTLFFLNIFIFVIYFAHKKYWLDWQVNFVFGFTDKNIQKTLLKNRIHQQNCRNFFQYIVPNQYFSHTCYKSLPHNNETLIFGGFSLIFIPHSNYEREIYSCIVHFSCFRLRDFRTFTRPTLASNF